ncbi:MAG TPA: hypothetical protein VEB20_13340 [Azospirillaceae bacterium]|nr:hypothetical protein [Azospirillaceae bacterium]
MTTQSAHGIACPGCRTPIKVTMEDLLFGGGVACHACGLELTLNREGSQEALEALREYHGKLQEAKEKAPGVLG